MARIAGTNGNNWLQGSFGNDTILGFSGNDVLYGNQGNDVLFGHQGNDSLYGNQGNDVLFGHQGNDVLLGGQGNDSLLGGQDHDELYGNQGNDSLYGGEGDDSLYGQTGDDILLGDYGNDYLNGGGRNEAGEFDILTGDAAGDATGDIGQDIFSLATNVSVLPSGQRIGDPGYLYDDILNPNGSTIPSRGFALITDFQLGEDRIELDGFVAHYELTQVFWGQSFGSADKVDTAIVYIGPQQNMFDVVGVLQDVSISSAYLQTNAFTYLG